MAAFYQLRTTAGTYLAVDLPTRWMIHAASNDISDRHRPLLLIRPVAKPWLSVLVADDPDPEIIFPPQGHLRTMLVLDTMLNGPAGDLSLVHPLTRQSVRPIEGLNDQGAGGITQDVLARAGCFSPELVERGQVRAELQHRAEALEYVFEHRSLSDGLLNCLRYKTPLVARHVLRAMLHSLSVADYNRLAEQLLQDSGLLERLAEAMPDDIWVTQGMAGLARRTAAEPHGRRAGPSPVEVPPLGVVPVALDHLATDGLYGQSVSFGHNCNLHARSLIKPKKKAGIIATARNEGLNLVEWVAYHRCIGFDGIVIYSNGNTDGSDTLLKALDAAGAITYIENQIGTVSPQQKAYGHALSLRAETVDYQWVAIIDLDEFVVFNPNLFGSLSQFLEWHETKEVDAIALNWAMIGSDGDSRRSDVPLVYRYRRLLHGAANAHVKSIFRPHKFAHSGPHFPHVHERRSFVFSAASGKPHYYDRQTDWIDSAAMSLTPDMTHACVFHYFFKSADEYLWKFARFRGDLAPSENLTFAGMDPHFVRSYVGQSRRTDDIETDWAIRCAPELISEIARLMRLPGVASAQRDVHEHYERQIVGLRQLFASADVIKKSGEDGPLLLDMLALEG